MMKKAIVMENLDLSVNPGDDFNQYANGGWIKNNRIPEDKSRFGSFDALMDENERQVRELVENLANVTNPEGSVAEKIAKFYNSGMDTLAIEQKGASILDKEFKMINEISTVNDIQLQLEYFHQHRINSGFSFYGSADAKNSDRVISYLSQSGLGLPDRDYYLSDADRFVKIREKYVLHVAKLFQLLGDTPFESEQKAILVFNFEKQLAEASMDRLSLRDPHKTYHKKTINELIELAPNFDWQKYLSDAGLNKVEEFIVKQPNFIQAFSTMLVNEEVDNWKAYFQWNLLNSTAAYLSKDFVLADFEFFGNTLSGTPELKPRWKRVLNATNNSLSEGVGQIYVEKYFPPEAKERMLNLVENLRIALGERIKGLDWMGEATKANGLEKLDAINVKIGYPDNWTDYTKLEVKDDAYVLNVLRAWNFSFKENMEKIDKPVDKTEWHMPPQMVNAYYSPTQNEIVFPAGILQPPFFYLDADDAVNYGAIGVVIGHEMTHGFDDKGRFYDKSGNLNTWWTDEDAERFMQRADVLVNQFNEFVVLDSVHANGQYTLGENIADLGGLNISYTGFKKTEQYKNKDEKIDGFTADQRFFLSYAKVWAQNIRDEEILRRTQEDVHSLGKFRVVGPLRNLDVFHKAFDIKENDYMYLPAAERAIIW
jgi:putative endopeptidase